MGNTIELDQNEGPIKRSKVDGIAEIFKLKSFKILHLHDA